MESSYAQCFVSPPLSAQIGGGFENQKTPPDSAFSGGPQENSPGRVNNFGAVPIQKTGVGSTLGGKTGPEPTPLETPSLPLVVTRPVAQGIDTPQGSSSEILIADRSGIFDPTNFHHFGEGDGERSVGGVRDMVSTPPASSTGFTIPRREDNPVE